MLHLNYSEKNWGLLNISALTREYQKRKKKESLAISFPPLNNERSFLRPFKKLATRVLSNLIHTISDSVILHFKLNHCTLCNNIRMSSSAPRKTTISDHAQNALEIAFKVWNNLLLVNLIVTSSRFTTLVFLVVTAAHSFLWT